MRCRPVGRSAGGQRHDPTGREGIVAADQHEHGAQCQQNQYECDQAAARATIHPRSSEGASIG